MISGFGVESITFKDFHTRFNSEPTDFREKLVQSVSLNSMKLGLIQSNSKIFQIAS